MSGCLRQSSSSSPERAEIRYRRSDRHDHGRGVCPYTPGWANVRCSGISAQAINRRPSHCVRKTIQGIHAVIQDTTLAHHPTTRRVEANAPYHATTLRSQLELELPPQADDLSVKRMQNSFGIFIDNAQKGFCRPFRTTSPLFPVLECAHTHSDDSRETRLGQTKALADSLRIWVRVLKRPGWLPLTLTDFSGLLDALTQFLKI